MTKLREIADKLGLPIEKEFRLDDEQFNKLVFKIDEEGNILFWNDNTVKFVLSSWSLIDIYTKGYVLVDESKEDNKDLDKVYLTLVLEMSEAFIRYQEDLLNKTTDIITISNIKRQDNKVKFILEETQRRLLNK